VQHPRQLDVGGELGLAAGAVEPVDARHLLPDRRQWPLRATGRVRPPRRRSRRPRTAFDFLLGADQSCQVLMASSILG
jgi:hypothetical protein